MENAIAFVMTGSLRIESTILNTTALADDTAFEALRHEWDELLEHSDQRSFFLRWSWNQLWWRAFRPAGSRLFIITCRDKQGNLVGLAPFYIKQRRAAVIPHIREINFLGTGVYARTSEHLDIIARSGHEAMVAGAVASFLRSSSQWDRLWLNDIPASSNVLAHFRQAIGDNHEVAVCGRSRYIETNTDWETYLRTLSRSTRHNLIRRMRNLFESHDCTFRLVETAQELELAMGSLVRLHQARWQSKGEPGSFAVPGVEEFLREAMRSSLAEGRLRLSVLELDGRIAAVRLAFFDNGIVYGFQGGFDPAYSKYSLGTLKHALCLQAAMADESVHEYDFLSGEEEYKSSWTKLSRESICLTHLRSGMRSSIYTSFEKTKRIGKTLLKVTIPAPIRAAGHRIIQKRHYSK